MIRTQVEERFSGFFEKWMRQLEDYLPLLLTVSRNKNQYHHHHHHDDDHDDGINGHDDGMEVMLVNKLTALHKDYYTMKWASAHDDVLAFFAPVWLSPFENALLWNTGWKPSVIFKLLESSVLVVEDERKSSSLSINDHDDQLPAGPVVDHHEVIMMMMSEQQTRKIECLKSRIRVEEEKVDREMERQQVAMADRRMVELVRLVNRISNSSSSGGGGGGGGEENPAATMTRVDGLVEAAMRELIAGLERVMKMADCVRLKTLKGVLDVLNPIQSVDLLAAFSMLQIQMRKWGKIKQQQHHRCI